jgi:hypothetical protein
MGQPIYMITHYAYIRMLYLWQNLPTLAFFMMSVNIQEQK